MLFFLSCKSTNNSENDPNVSAILPNEKNTVKAMRLAYTDFNHEIISNGIISATKKADLQFDLTDIIEKIYVKNGQRVSNGQKIAELNQFKLNNSLKQSRDNLEKAKLELQDVLISQGYVLRDSLKIPPEIMKIAKIKSNYDNSVTQYELASHNFENSVLYSPFNGIVANLVTKEYNIPSTSDPFCTIINDGDMDADFMVLESELPIIDIWDRVEISPYSINDYTINGKITEINPIVNENGMIKVKASVTRSQKKLYDGMNIRIKIQRSVEKQLVIPKEALVLRNNKKVVFTLNNHKANWNYVQTGLENSTGYIVTEGLNEGDSIIYLGNLNLAHESPVNPIN